MQATEQSKDTMIFTKSTSVGVDSKGREMIALRFNEEQTKQLVEELTKVGAQAKLQIHIGEGAYGPSAFLFVKEVQAAPGTGGGGRFNKGTPSGSADKISALKKAAK